MYYPKQSLILLATGSIILAAGCTSKTDKGKTAGSYANGLTTAIEGMVIKPQAIDQSIEVSGTIIPYEETALQSEIAGRVVSLNLPEGQTVQKGTLLVKLYDGDLQAQLKQYQIQLKIAKATEARQKELLEANGISRQDYDLSLLQVSNLEAQIELIQVDIGKTEIRAPFTGTIGLKNISNGAYLAPSTVIATIRSDNALKLDFSVPEKYTADIRAGKIVTFTTDGSEKQYTATVIATEQFVESSTRNLNIRALIKQPQGLVPGSSAKIRLALDTRSDAVVIPTQSLIPQARDKKVIVSRNGKATFITVKTGVRQPDSIEILEGLHAGDTIVVTGLLFVKPDSRLKFSKIN